MIAISREFKTIVFFGSGFSQIAYIKEAFSTFPSVRVFQSNIADEIVQILSQSAVTAILIKNTFHIAELVDENVLSLKAAGVRIYYLDDGSELAREEIERFSLMKITTLSSISDFELRKKLEMFLLSKLRLNEGSAPIKSSSDEDPPKPSYFTHFKKIDNKWGIYVSTHEQEIDVETMFEKSWTLICLELIKKADEVTEMTEDPEFSATYLSIIYPHQYADSSRALSLMHIKKDVVFAATYQRALDFLAKI